jgi:hypothetical protein
MFTNVSSCMIARFRPSQLIAVALTAGALLSVTTAASADPKGPADPGVRCAAKVGPGQYEFYLPGEKATDVNGNRWVCGPDGQWFRDYSALVVVRQRPVRSLLPLAP